MNDQDRLIDLLKRADWPPEPSPADAREENLRRLLCAAMPPVEASDALRQRVRDLAAAPPARLRSSRPRFFPHPLRWALAGALLVVALLIPLRKSSTGAAEALQRMQTAIRDVRSMHETDWRITQSGQRVAVGSTWYQAGKWRMDGVQDGGVTVSDGSRVWTYDRKANQVMMRRAESPFGYNRSGFSLAAMQRDFARWGWHQQVKLLGSTHVNGHSVWQFSIQQPDRLEREVLQVNAATDLPERTEYQTQTAGRWITSMASEYGYNRPLSATLFEPHFPASAHWIDWDREREAWRKRLAPGMARTQIAHRRIVLRNLWVNADGDVFLLYTANKPPPGYFPDWRVKLTDSLGTPYQEAYGLDPYLPTARAHGWPGYTFGGDEMLGKWWIPMRTQRPWKPRRFTFTIWADPSNGDSRPARGGTQSAAPERQAIRGTITAAVTAPGPTIVPPYRLYMVSLMDENQIRRQTIEAQARFYRQVTDPFQSGDLSKGARHRSDLSKALACYQEIVRMDEAGARESGDAPHDPGVWTNIGKVLYRLGRLQEARAAFERAIGQSEYQEGSRDWSRQEPEELLNGLTHMMAWQTGKPAPPAWGLDLDGHRHSVAEYRGHVLLVTLWNRFANELPAIKSLDRRYGTSGLAVLGVCIDVNWSQLRQYIQKQQLSWPNLYDDKDYFSEVGGRFGYSWDFTRLPRTILIDRQGVVRHIDLHGAALESAVSALIQERYAEQSESHHALYSKAPEQRQAGVTRK